MLASAEDRAVLDGDDAWGSLAPQRVPVGVAEHVFGAVVAERATIRAEARGHDPGFRNKIVRAIEKAFDKATQSVRSSTGRRGTILITKRLDYEAFRIPQTDLSVVTARKALESIGYKPYYDVSNGGLDANWMAANGIPTVTLGCGQHAIHTTNEWLDLTAYKAACHAALILATS